MNPCKTNIMVFTKKYKPELIEPLKFWGKKLNFSSSMKYLGVSLDPKLSWKQHLQDKRKKFYVTMGVCRRAMGKTWGLKPVTALWLYRAILLPRLLYASVVWWPRVEKGEAKNLLRSLQGNYLRAVTGSMETTPTEMLEVALCIHPLDLNIIKTASLTAYRLKCRDEWRDIRLGHIRLRWLSSYHLTQPQDKTVRKHRMHKGFEAIVPSREDWRNNNKFKDPNISYWYTNGLG